MKVALSGGAPLGPGVCACPGETMTTVTLCCVLLLLASLAVSVCVPTFQPGVIFRSAWKLPLGSLVTLWLPGRGVPSSRKVIGELPENFCPLMCSVVPFAPARVLPTLNELLAVMTGCGRVRKYAAAPMPPPATTTMMVMAITTVLIESPVPAALVATAGI